MTVIAWDGKTLAADSQTNDCGAGLRTKKLYRTKSGLLIGGCGDTHLIHEMHQWFENGRKKDELPERQKTSDAADFMCIEPYYPPGSTKPLGRILIYGRSHVPFEVLEPYWAIGSGRDVALGVLFCNRTAKEAVQAACYHVTSCGRGTDTLELTS